MKSALTPREVADKHIEQALATGIRGAARDLLKEARLALRASSSRGPALTDAECRNIKPGQTLKDPSCPGLSLKNGPRTGTIWVYRYKRPGTDTPREAKLGSYPELALSDVRVLWEDAWQAKAKGDDPAHVLRQSEVAGANSLTTVSDLVKAYLGDYARKVKRSWATDERLLNRHLLPAYGTTAAADFGHREAATIIHDLHDTAPREAEKLRACISTVWNFANGRTRKVLVKDGNRLLPPTHPNPVEAVVLPQRMAKNYKPSTQDLTAYLRALDAEAVRYAPVLRLQALTMTRISEVSGLGWNEVDLAEGRWTLPAARAKNGREHLILLSPQCLVLLRAQHEKTGHLIHVFPGRNDPSKPVSSGLVQTALIAARPKLGLPDAFVTHSLRHAAITWAAGQGCPREVRDRLTNHVSGGGVDAIYNAATHDRQAQEWWARWADYLDRLVAKNVTILDPTASEAKFA